jgi:hypothetical protein
VDSEQKLLDTAKKPDAHTERKLSGVKRPSAARAPNKLPEIRKLSEGYKHDFDERVQEMFRLQEGELLLQGLDKVDRMKQFYDQITVLRGVAYNGLICSLLCAFAGCGNLRAQWSSRRVVRPLTFLPPALMVVYASWSLWEHFWIAPSQSLYGNPPLAEFVLFVLGVVGFFVVAKATETPFYFRNFVLAAVITLISFGGWWYTEMMYDLFVIHSQPELLSETSAPKSAAATLVPVIAKINPLPTGSRPQTLEIDGTGFLPSSTVALNNIPHEKTFVSPEQLTISLTPADLATRAALPVVVRNPASGGGESLVLYFVVPNP